MEQWKMESSPLALDARKALLSLARRTLKDRLLGPTEAALVDTLPESLSEPRGAFVTLTLGGHLRGCIGTFRPTEPLYEVVRRMALSAAFQDPRFPPLNAGELDAIEIEISVLSPLRRVDDIEEIQVGTHGLYITRGYHSGVLLPQVAVDWGWDREEFLEHTCLKAGLDKNAWRHGATIELFHAEVFSEAEPEGSLHACR